MELKRGGIRGEQRTENNGGTEGLTHNTSRNKKHENLRILYQFSRLAHNFPLRKVMKHSECERSGNWQPNRSAWDSFPARVQNMVRSTLHGIFEKNPFEFSTFHSTDSHATWAYLYHQIHWERWRQFFGNTSLIFLITFEICQFQTKVIHLSEPGVHLKQVTADHAFWLNRFGLSGCFYGNPPSFRSDLQPKWWANFENLQKIFRFSCFLPLEVLCVSPGAKHSPQNFRDWSFCGF